MGREERTKKSPTDKYHRSIQSILQLSHPSMFRLLPPYGQPNRLEELFVRRVVSDLVSEGDLGGSEEADLNKTSERTRSRSVSVVDEMQGRRTGFEEGREEGRKERAKRTFKFPSAVILSRLQVPQKCSVCEYENSDSLVSSRIGVLAQRER